MKSVMLAASLGLASISATHAADMPVKAVEHHHHVYDWTGFYVGGHVGYEWARVHDVQDVIVPGFVADSKIGAWAAGFHAGAQLQMGHNPWGGGWVLGIEAAHTLLGKGNSTGNFAPCANPAFTCGLGGLGITTLGARFGVSVDRWLLTVAGGCDRSRGSPRLPARDASNLRRWVLRERASQRRLRRRCHRARLRKRQFWCLDPGL